MSRLVKLSKCRTVGNDWIIIDNRSGSYDDLVDDVQFKHFLNDKTYGLGGMGLMEARHHPTYPFEIVHHAGSGEVGTACNTGVRSTSLWAAEKGVFNHDQDYKILATEGEKTVRITSDGHVITCMNSDAKIKKFDDNNYFVDPGAGRIHVRFLEDDLDHHDIVKEGYELTESLEYGYGGTGFPPVYIAINILSKDVHVLKIACFDRHASASTQMYACGTGSTSASLVYLMRQNLLGKHKLTIQWPGGDTFVSATREAGNCFRDITIMGPAFHLFDVEIDVDKFKNTYRHLKPYSPTPFH